MFPVKANTRTHLTALISVISASALLVGCAPSGTEDAAPANDEAASGASTTAEPQYDTGSYRTEPHPGWTMDDKLGEIVETHMIAENTLLPYEVDGHFTQGDGKQNLGDIFFLQAQFQEPVSGALKAVEPNFLTGYSYGGSTEKKDRSVTNAVYRFTDADSARQAADIIAVETPNIEPEVSMTGEEQKDFPIEIPGYPDAVAHNNPSYASTSAVVVHNEFLVYSFATNEFDFEDPDSFEETTAPEAQEWMPGYISAFFDKQIPLLDTIPTKKTEQGYGMSDQWPEMDPDNILKYVVMAPEDVEREGPPPSATNNRFMASNYRNQKDFLETLDRVKPLAMAQGESMLFRTKNKPDAELLRASFLATDVTGEEEEYEEPQGLPGTTCYTNPVEHGKVYYCYLVHENYFATASVHDVQLVLEMTPEVGGKETEAEEEKIDPRKKLSQIMAAQYALLKDAPTEG